MFKDYLTTIITTDKLSYDDVFSNKGCIYTFLNPVSYLIAIENKSLFKQMDGLFVDGSILVLAIKIFYSKTVKRMSFDMTSVAPKLFDYATENGKTLYFIASKQEQIEKSIEVFQKRYPSIKIAGYRNGYFKSLSEQVEECCKIRDLNPDFLIVGMGVVAQEDFLLKAKTIGYNGIGFTCGGFIHQTSKDEIDYYPKWVDKLNIRFLYRMHREKHTRIRYLKAAFIFPIIFLWNKFF